MESAGGRARLAALEGAEKVGARQLVRQDGGRAANFRVRNRCNLPRRARTGERLQKGVA